MIRKFSRFLNLQMRPIFCIVAYFPTFPGNFERLLELYCLTEIFSQFSPGLLSVELNQNAASVPSKYLLG
jgi:hypothetical protein